MGAGNHPRTRTGQERGPRHGGQEHHGGHHDPHPGRAHHNGETSAAPAPPNTPTHTTEANIEAIRDTPAHAHRPPETTRRTEGTPTRGVRATPTEEAAGNAAARRTTTPSPPGDDPNQAPEEDETTAAAPTATDPQRTRDKGTGPQGGQPHGPSRDHTMGYKGRAALPSRFDAEYCYALGLTAGGLISAGLTSVRASVTNLLRPVEEWHCGGTPIPSMMNFERRKGK